MRILHKDKVGFKTNIKTTLKFNTGITGIIKQFYYTINYYNKNKFITTFTKTIKFQIPTINIEER